ncbi:hypothetical protein HHK36_010267 [Tetracentron sinense]|uniref:Uncharacterized protein n=1 Tax=Tetracentron sinense TaxID=13715 RepID=A0A835DIB1_TETSI|nr:hypothetical protein HHK36_010267 [Tetracentron sinense]
METPLSMRRVTRSQTSATMNSIPLSRKNEESEKGLSRQRNGKPDRSALIDITNDSPIVGLAMGNSGAPSSLAKKRNQPKTPGSGEALLRGQVKTLLQKVEEEAELSKLSFEHCSFLNLQGSLNSPSGLLAPTPVNTPQVPNLTCVGITKSTTCNGIDEDSKIPPVFSVQAVTDIIDPVKQETLLESQKSLLNRSLLFDFSENLENSDSSECYSELTYQEANLVKSMDEDDASVWSIQVNASTHDEDFEEEEEDNKNEDEIEEEEEEDYEEVDEDGGSVDELCEGLSKISVQEKRMPKFEGKHTRFVYNSDNEIEGEEEVTDNSSAVSPGVLRLKGLPTPEGKHLRFPEE